MGSTDGSVKGDVGIGEDGEHSANGNGRSRSRSSNGSGHVATGELRSEDRRGMSALSVGDQAIASEPGVESRLQAPPGAMVQGEEVRAAASDQLTVAEQAIELAVRQILANVGEDPDREGLLKTPYRVAKMFRELLGGYEKDVATVVNGALFEVDYGDGEMVVVADIPFDSLCEHHMLPFTGSAHVAYLPGNRVVGLSKIPRIVEMFARRLQIQERLGNEIADALEAAVAARGVIVLIEGQHSCAALRGVKKHGMNMVTTALRGEFRTNLALRDEFYRMIGR